jgi:lipid-A-disaccharide synthase
MPAAARPRDVFVIAGEASGDQLGAAFMRAARQKFGADGVRFRGVGGDAMAAEGLASQFPMHDLSVMGFSAVAARLPLILRRLRETADALRTAPPDLLLTIDSPDFSLRVAKRLRRAAPAVPIVHWVCPSVWAWRPWRARRMRPHVDRILCLLPFEPAALARLGGPEGVYVGHPLLERLGELRPAPDDALCRNDAARPEVLLLPGSRRSELAHLLPVFADVAARLATTQPAIRFTLPTLPHLAERVAAAVASWPVKPAIVVGETEKHAAFRRARAALAASGTVSLELGLSGVPTVIAYQVGPIEAAIARRLIIVSHAGLPSLILGEEAMPEFIQQRCRADLIAPALADLVGETRARSAQLAALARLGSAMQRGHNARSPSAAAVEAVADLLGPDVAQRR